MSETGHARNVGNFEILISRCTGFGAPYNPANADIAIAALSGKLTLAQSAMDDTSAAIAAEKVGINDRQDEFEGIRRLVTRVVNAFEAGGASAKDVEDARSFKRKIDGSRAKAVEDPKPGEPPNTKKTSSVSQQSYVQLVEHFTNLIDVLEKSNTYKPNETELQIAQLKTKRNALEAATTTVNDLGTATANARLLRDQVLYDEAGGVCSLAALVKKYVKALFGADSAEFKQISDLKFTFPRP